MCKVHRVKLYRVTDWKLLLKCLAIPYLFLSQFSAAFNCDNKKKSPEAKSGEWGGWKGTVIWFLGQNWWIGKSETREQNFDIGSDLWECRFFANSCDGWTFVSMVQSGIFRKIYISQERLNQRCSQL